MKLLYSFLFVFATFSFNTAFAQNTCKEYKSQLKYVLNKKNFESENERLTAFFDLYIKHYKYIYPVTATYYGDKENNHRWDNMSSQGRKEKKDFITAYYKASHSFTMGLLSADNQNHLRILKRNLKNRQQLFVQFPEEFFSVEQVRGFHQTIPTVLKIMPLKTEQDIENYIERLKGISGVLTDLEKTLKLGIKQGVVMPRNTVMNVPQQVENIISNDFDTNEFLQPLLKLKNKKEIQNQAWQIIQEDVNPAFLRFQKFMENEYIPQSRTTYGLSALKNGNAWYDARIQYHTTTNLSAKEIHEIGKQEVKRILNEMKSIRDELKFQGSQEEFHEFLRTDAQFYYTDKEDLLTGYRDICKRIDPELPRFFKTLPRLPYGVKEIPSFTEKSAPTAYYASGSLEARRAGYFFANTYNLQSRPKWEMEALTIHEAVPGHHLQISLAKELENFPEFRDYIFFTAFVEGWALYSESLGEELGLYQDLYSKYGQLTFEMWRAVRLVVDTGIHAFGWSRQEAIDYFVAHSSKSLHDIEVEVDRYIAWPGQALSYKIGELKIKALKQEAQKELGQQFDVREFHNVLLENGSIPLDVLEENVKKWIEQVKK